MARWHHQSVLTRHLSGNERNEKTQTKGIATERSNPMGNASSPEWVVYLLATGLERSTTLQNQV